MLRRIMSISLTVVLLLAVAPLQAQETPVTKESVREAVMSLDVANKAAGKAFTPYRRGAADDRASWSGVADIYRAVGVVADEAAELSRRAVALQEQPESSLKVSPREFRLRVARADSLTALARQLATTSWNAGLSDDDEEARHQVDLRAEAAKQLAARTAVAAGDIAYAVGVTEGVSDKSLILSAIGIVVVFVVLTLIALVVGAIRKLDDGWKEQEQVQKVEALAKEPTIDATTTVLIAAACATVITGRFRVRRVRRLLSPSAKRTPWSAQGRLILQGSHSVTRKS